MRAILLTNALVVTALLSGAGQSAVSQVPAQTSAYPMNDIPVTLSSGTVVRVRNVVVVQNQGETSLTLYIQTPTPPSEPDKVASEAKEVAKFQLKSPVGAKISTVTVGVCRTQACLETSEVPKEMFSFVRQSDGSLKSEKVDDHL